MITAEIRQLVAARPFVPFTIHTEDGAEVRVPTARHIAVPPSAWRIFVFGDQDDYQVLSPLQITRLALVH